MLILKRILKRSVDGPRFDRLNYGSVPDLYEGNKEPFHSITRRMFLISVTFISSNNTVLYPINSVDISKGWTTEFRFPARARYFSLLRNVQTKCGPHPVSHITGKRIHRFPVKFTEALGPTQSPIKWVAGSLSPEVKRQGRETDKSHCLVPRLIMVL
jgi:hypothetical protein